jgi:hypothetical protein
MQTTAPHVVQKTLRQAQLYGYLIARSDRLYHPGGNKPVCSLHIAKQMVGSGLLRVQADKFEITPEGSKALRESNQ